LCGAKPTVRWKSDGYVRVEDTYNQGYRSVPIIYLGSIHYTLFTVKINFH